MNTISPHAKSMLTVFGLGAMRPFSGTWGSLPPVVLGWVLCLIGTPRSLFDILMIVLIVVFSAACVIWGTEAEAHWKKDPGHVVADETAGQAVTLLLLPNAVLGDFWSFTIAMAASFFLFRGFDILKPWPAGAMQSIRGGWGILLDDLIAGAMAAAIIWIAHLI